ncbi:hypothetical protein N0V84_010049 [Fusarium piperis]|uniref:Alpha/beta hydrolase fold-3 domain-containing protein n=1 Tax=Fusarium piperis TaxID=1435070 RepID=A0A9W9BJD4_9HYPO|nr:hypothetical protein N0V84_010049 [Fusarium piperis]
MGELLNLLKAAVLAQRARDVENVAFSGQVLRNPLVVHTDALPSDLDFSSYTENVNAPVLPTPAVTQCLNYYGAPPEDIRVSPLLATDLSGLPPAYIQIAGADPLRDDGFAYSERLHRAGAQKSDEDLIKAIEWLTGTQN